MARDPELEAFLVTPFPNDLDDVAATRLAQATLTADAPSVSAMSSGVHWRDEAIDGSDSTKLMLRIYRDVAVSGPQGALLFFHGGAFVFGDLTSEHARCLRLADGSGCVVVSVDYRLAPEHPFPAAVDDGVAALRWLFEHANSMGIDTARIGIGGASAGGTLAVVTATRFRDEGGAALQAQLLIYPATDDQAAEGSIEQFWHCEPWDGERTRKMWPLYLSDESATASPYASPARRDDLRGTPTTYVMVAEEDPLRDEAIAYALRLLSAGTSVDLRLFAHTFHGFDVVAPSARLSEVALAEQRNFLERELGSRST